MSTYAKQTIEAALWTFAEVFLATFAAGFAGIASGDWDALGTLAATAGLAALAAVLSIIKSVVVRNIGAKDSVFISE
jgi:hypothetical protein